MGGIGQVELVEQLGGAPAARSLAHVPQIGHQDQVLLAGEELVHGRELARDADRRRGLRPARGSGRARRPGPGQRRRGSGSRGPGPWSSSRHRWGRAARRRCPGPRRSRCRPARPVGRRTCATRCTRIAAGELLFVMRRFLVSQVSGHGKAGGSRAGMPDWCSGSIERPAVGQSGAGRSAGARRVRAPPRASEAVIGPGARR